MPDAPATELGGGEEVAHITGLNEVEIWELGRNTLNLKAYRTSVVGRADLQVSAVRDIGLRVIRDDVGFVRHSCIGGWPTGDDADARHKEMAKDLATAARLIRRG